MAEEVGHHTGRVYIGHDGAIYLNGAAFYNDAGADISDSLEVLNSLAPAELSYLDGLTAGTAAASKAVVLDANAHTSAVKTTALYIGASGSAVQVTATAAELNYCDVTTVGIAQASKAVVLDANKHVDEVNTASLKLGATGATVAVTATAAEINTLDRTGAAGVAEASKAVILDAAKHVDEVNTASLKLGATGATVAVTATAAELNYCDITAAGTVDASKAVVVDGNKDVGDFRYVTLQELKCTGNIGAAAGTGNAATEYGDGTIHRTVLTLTNVAVALADEPGQIAYGSLKLYDFPEGAIAILGAVADLDLTKSSAGVNADWDGDFALGTVAAGNDADLTSTEADILPKTATPQAVAGVTTANGANAAIAFLDGTTTAKDLLFNVLVDDADHDVAGTACNLILNGTITITWIKLGDY